MIKLGHKNLYISFQNKVDPIQLVLKSLEVFKHSPILLFSSIIVTFSLILDPAFISRDLPFLILIKLTYYPALTIQTYINTNIDFTLSQPILDFIQSQGYSKCCLESVYSLLLLYSLIPFNILPKQLVNQSYNYSKVFDLNPVVYIYTNKRLSFYNILISRLFKDLNNFRGRQSLSIISIDKSNDIYPIIAKL